MSNLGEKFMQHQKVLLQYAMYLTKNIDEAEELMQDTALKVLKCNKYKEEGKFIAWAKTVMWLCFLDMKAISNRTATDGYDAIPEDKIPYSMNEADAEYQQAEMNIIINALPQKHALSFWLAFKGYQYDEIADKMNTSVSNIKNYIHKARISLRKELKER